MPSDAIALIPARYGSSRFPGKPLAHDTGKPLIQHVIERVRQAETITRVVVATDDQRIAEAVQRIQAEAVMTATDHPNGTSRIAEALTRIEPAVGDAQRLVVNVQGDEPEIEPQAIDRLVHTLSAQPHTPMATLGSPITDHAERTNPNIVKLVADQTHHALYFSRAPIPHHRDSNAAEHAHPSRAPQAPTLGIKHLGIYAYRPWFVPQYTRLAPTPLEQAEKLEQLRVLEHGYRIAVDYVHAPHPGLDTPEQYQAFVKRMKGQTSGLNH